VHSGITGLVNAAYNRCKGLILILDNGTTAMTGGQNHPATGKTVRNEPTYQLKLEELCKACGADNVDVVRPQEYKQMVELIKARAEAEALSVIIVRSPCMLLR
jgi:indolepyruvate ferredoxin oxidoreductase alpha subunit